MTQIQKTSALIINQGLLWLLSPALDVPVLFLPLVMETQQPKTMDDPKNRHKGESLKKTYREYMINAGIVAPSMNLISDRARSVALLIDLLTIYTHRALN